MNLEQLRHLCHQYLEELRCPSSSATEESTFHTSLHKFIESIAKQIDSRLKIEHEPRKTPYGRPDFIVTINDLPIGYIEAESINADLDNLKGKAKEQIERFRNNLDNFLLTNFWDFRLYREKKEVAAARLPKPTSKRQPTQDELEQLSNLLNNFFTWQGLSIRTPKDLAVHLARRARQLRNEILNALKDNEKGELSEFRDAFKKVLLPDLTDEKFADMFAQTVAYGLFAARCELTSISQPFTRSQAADLIPHSNPFLRKLFQRLAAHDLDERIAWIADDIAQLLANADMAAFLKDFGRKFSKEDPVVYFYEDFLREYDPQLREVRGVYYTPDPIVSYIVRSVDALLKKHFGMSDGLADKRALILDPACGTGTFLSWVIRLVYETVTQKHGKGSWDGYVHERLLPHLFGFELLVAPYTIAHLKLSLQLKETGYKFHEGERLHIYLTNSLEGEIQQSELPLGRFISDEANAATKIKREERILVVIGNPPYSGHSANKSRWIIGLIEDYKKVNGQPLRERNPKWLQDDYVKFIRFAQWRIEQTGEGVIGFITNHSWLDNPTFRGMRWNLLNSFNEIYILNLHGNIRRKEKAHYGDNDENVFDIQQGVAIMLAVKRKNKGNGCQVFYYDLWGKRECKYNYLSEKDVTTTKWQKLQPTPPLYLFVPQDLSLQKEYEEGFKVTEIFSIHSVGIVTARNKLTIQFTHDEMWETVKKFVSLDPEDARERFGLGKDTDEWQVEWAQKDLKNAKVPNNKAKSKIVCILYRPFDVRFTFYTGKNKGFHCRPRHKVMKHMLAGENWGLITARQQSQKGERWALVGVSKFIIESCVISNKTKEINYLFPLYLYLKQGPLAAKEERERNLEKKKPNLKKEFLERLSKRLKLPQVEPFGLPEGITPEDIFGYIYAILHSNQYRERYAEFLRYDFPRIPLTSDLQLFRDLAELGKKLVKVHLLEEVPDYGYGKFEIEGSNEVKNVRYEVDQRVLINDSQYFAPVPQEVWEFRVGSYQPAKEWLEDRKGRKLTINDIEHYRKILSVIAETLKIINEIDNLLSFPIE